MRLIKTNKLKNDHIICNKKDDINYVVHLDKILINLRDKYHYYL